MRIYKTDMFSVMAAGVTFLMVTLPPVTARATAEEGAVGLPQLDASTYSSQIFWLIVSFLCMYVLMARTVLPKISDVLDLRNSEINGNLSRAERLEAEIENVKTSYEKALAQAQADAQDVVNKIQAKTSQKVTDRHQVFAESAHERIQKSEQNIAEAKEDVLKSLEDIAADLTRDALKKVADVTVSKTDALKAVKSKMKGAA